MPSWRHIHFEWQHVDEKILHFVRPSKIQTIIEVLNIVLPLLIIIIVILSFWWANFISFLWTFILLLTVIIPASLTVFYKLYRAKRNYLYITSKRVLFHGMEWLFRDYIKKITYENIRNVNYSTDSLWGRIFGYGTLNVQSSHGGEGDITVYHIEFGKMLTHYIDKVISLSPEERTNFSEFDTSYFKNWKK